MSSSAKAMEPAFQGAGQKVGTEIWRIENFQPVPLPKSDYGKFYSGDSYIILQTSSGKGGSYLFDIHFWIGKDTSQDEAGTAAIKTVELDAVLGGRAVQYREVQGFESDKFLSYFKPCIIPLEGGVASGFKKPEEEEFETRLYICRGKRAVRLKQVPFSRSSLNHDDVFILDTQHKIYQFNGENSNIQERAKALKVIQFLKEKYHEGACDVAIVDLGKLQAETDSGGFAPIGKKVASEDDIIPEKTTAQLYCIIDNQVESVNGELSKSILENNKCYLLDCGSEIYVWVGRVTQVDERKTAIQAADDFVASQDRRKSTRITQFIQGYETLSFKSNFDSWPSGSAAPVAEEGRGKVEGDVMKGASRSALVNEEVPSLLEGGGKIEVWRINGSERTPVPNEDIGKFYSGDCYVVLYTYHSQERIECFYLCSWIGKDSIEEDQKVATQLSTDMFISLMGKPVLGRIYQGKEPPQFVAIFQHMIVLKGGLSSGYKNYIADKGLNDETYTANGVALIRISGTLRHNNKAVQVEAVATSLNSNECFLLQSGSSIFSWHGTQSTVEQQQLADKIAEFLKPGSTIKHTKEGTESSSFWFALGGKQSSSDVVRDAHLFAFSINKGKFEVEEIYNFSQDDLLTEDILILDTQAEVFVWVGQSVDSEKKQSALDVGQKYVELAASLEGLPPNVPLYTVTEGFEPCFFTTYFSWDPAKANADGNSFQKVMLFCGLGHASEASLSDEDFKSLFNTEMEKSMEKSDAQFNTEMEQLKSDDVSLDESDFIATNVADIPGNVFVAGLAIRSRQYKAAFGELVRLANTVERLSLQELLMLEETFLRMVKPKVNYLEELCKIKEVKYDGAELEWFREVKDSLRTKLISDYKEVIRILDCKAEKSCTQQLMRAEITWKLVNILKPGEEAEHYKDETQEKYVMAFVLGKPLLHSHPTKLAVVLALAKFNVVVRNNTKTAKVLAERAVYLAKDQIQMLEAEHRANAKEFLKKLEKLASAIRGVEHGLINSKDLLDWTNDLVVFEGPVAHVATVAGTEPSTSSSSGFDK